jgi:hypothetical protein
MEGTNLGLDVIGAGHVGMEGGEVACDNQGRTSAREKIGKIGLLR